MFPDWSIALCFAFIAFVYASVGFGGGSSYLALLAVLGLPFQEIKLIALLCNVIVVTGGTFLFFQNKSNTDTHLSYLSKKTGSKHRA